MLLATRTCLICNIPLTFHQAKTSKLCGNPQCQWNYSRVPSHQTCAVCARPLLLRELAGRVCGNAECQRALFAERRKKERQELEVLKEQARTLRSQAAEAVGIKEPDSYALTVIPSFSAPVINVPERRRRALRDRIMPLISQAMIGQGAPSEPAESAPPVAPAIAAQAVLGRACAQCQGRCCRGGGDHAYLTVDAIRRYMEAHPNLRPREVLAAYLGRVGNKTYQGSCIYHSTNGCGLPAEMRSDTCNHYFCEGLKEFKRSVANTSPIRVFLASASEGTIRNAAFVDEIDIRVVIRLRRRQKKRRAASVEKFSFAITTNGLAECATCPAETVASTWPTTDGASIARGVRG